MFDAVAEKKDGLLRLEKKPRNDSTSSSNDISVIT
jgi:hypothetical protein